MLDPDVRRGTLRNGALALSTGQGRSYLQPAPSKTGHRLNAGDAADLADFTSADAAAEHVVWPPRRSPHGGMKISQVAAAARNN